MSKKSKGAQFFEFDFILGEIIPLNCHVTVRFGKIESVACLYNGKTFDTDGIVIDWYGEFVPMSQALKENALQFLDDAKIDDEMIDFLVKLDDCEE